MFNKIANRFSSTFFAVPGCLVRKHTHRRDGVQSGLVDQTGDNLPVLVVWPGSTQALLGSAERRDGSTQEAGVDGDVMLFLFSAHSF